MPGKGFRPSLPLILIPENPDLKDNMTKTLEDYRNIHAGNRCFVVGNGPSLNNIDMSRLASEITFGSNRIYHGFEKWGFGFTYWSIEDKLVAEDIAAEWTREMLSEPRYSSTVFVPQDLMHLVEEHVTDFRNPCCPVSFSRKPFAPNLPEFSTDPAKVVWGGTVTFLLFQLAVIMGCDPIILLGIDFSYTVPKSVKQLGGFDLMSTDNDPNHFFPDYFGKGRKWHVPDVSRMKLAYLSAQEASKRHGFRVYNATPGTKLTVFPQIDYEDCLKGDYPYVKVSDPIERTNTGVSVTEIKQGEKRMAKLSLERLKGLVRGTILYKPLKRLYDLVKGTDSSGTVRQSSVQDQRPKPVKQSSVHSQRPQPLNFREQVLVNALGLVEKTRSSESFYAIEIGCMFKTDEGLSTYRIADFIRKNKAVDKLFVSIEYDPGHVEAAQQMIRQMAPDLLDTIDFSCGHSLKVLPAVLGNIPHVDFAFLDGGAHPEVCLQEFELVLSRLSPEGVVVVDDVQELGPSELYPVQRPFGKGTLILPYLVIAEYLAGREQYRDRNNQFSSADEGVPDAETLSLTDVRGMLQLLGSRGYRIVSRGQHKMLIIGKPDLLTGLLKRLG
jgi:predicted O-methyltransferase YrrM